MCLFQLCNPPALRNVEISGGNDSGHIPMKLFLVRNPEWTETFPRSRRTDGLRILFLRVFGG